MIFDNITDEATAIKIQNQLKKFIILNNDLDYNKLEKVAGVDLAYWKEEDKEYAVCSIVIIDYNTKKVLEKVYSIGEINFPYIPGCLAFRELPLVLETVKKLKIMPDIYLFDGNGYLHPRHMGIATHAFLYLKKPTIGVAKNYYKINNTDFIMPKNFVGAYTDIVINGEVYGRVLRTHKNVKPIFVSVGNYIDLDISTNIVNRLISKESHLPIPLRIAHIETCKIKRRYSSKKP